MYMNVHAWARSPGGTAGEEDHFLLFVVVKEIVEGPETARFTVRVRVQIWVVAGSKRGREGKVGRWNRGWGRWEGERGREGGWERLEGGERWEGGTEGGREGGTKKRGGVIQIKFHYLLQKK